MGGYTVGTALPPVKTIREQPGVEAKTPTAEKKGRSGKVKASKDYELLQSLIKNLDDRVTVMHRETGL